MKEKVVSKAFTLSGILWFPIPIAAGFIALSASSLGINITDPNTVGPIVAGEVLGVAGGVMVFIVVFCSLASSIDSLLAATSDLFVEDIFKKLMHPKASEAQLRMAAKMIVVGLGFATWLLAYNEYNLLDILYLSGPLVASAIWPILGGLYWKRANSTGAVTSMLLGSSIGLYAYYTLGWYTASLISAGVSLLVMSLSASLLNQPFDWGKFSQNKKENQKAVS